MTELDEIGIRPAVESDREALVRLTVELQAFEQAFEPNRSSPAAMAAPYLDEVWQWTKDRSGAILVAQAPSGALVGYAACGLGAGGLDSLPEYERLGRVTDLVVARPWRAKGVGSALIRASEQVLRAAGAMRMEIAALSGNEGAIAAYQACGYRPCYIVFERYLGGPLADAAERSDD